MKDLLKSKTISLFLIVTCIAWYKLDNSSFVDLMIVLFPSVVVRSSVDKVAKSGMFTKNSEAK